MKLVIQRVKSASVSVSGEKVSEIGTGLFVLVGVTQTDTEKQADFLAEKVSKMRLMSDDADKMNLTVSDVDGEILVVSQFTLYSDTSGGNRPSFLKAARPDIARPIYERFVEKLKEKGIPVKTGRFGEYMMIDPVFDGPVTIVMEEKAST